MRALRTVAVGTVTTLIDPSDSNSAGQLFTDLDQSRTGYWEYSTSVLGVLDSLPALLARLAPRFADGAGLVVLTRGAAAALDLWPSKSMKPDPDAKRNKEWAGLASAREAGWNVSALSPFMTFWANARPTVHVAIAEWADVSQVGAFASGLAADKAHHLSKHHVVRFAVEADRYHALLGRPFNATPGVSGIGLLRDGIERKKAPYWKPATARWPADTGNAEYDMVWKGPRHPGSHVHAYDANLAYLGTARMVELAHGDLEHHHGGVFDRTRAGYWQTTTPAWNDPNMPHPMGYRTQTNGLVWVTTSTFQLIRELADQGVIAEPRVLASYTAPGRRLLEPWAAKLKTAIYDAGYEIEHQDDNPDRLVLAALKQTYSATVGMLNRETARVYRPDWRHEIIARTRSNLWRKAWRVGMATGHWPVGWNVDSLRYASDDPDPVAACPTGLTIGTQPGQFHPETIKEDVTA